MIDKYVIKNIDEILINPLYFIGVTIFNFFVYLYLFKESKVFLIIFLISFIFVCLYSLQRYKLVDFFKTNKDITIREMFRISIVLLFFIIGIICLVFLLVIEGLILGLYLITLFVHLLDFLFSAI